MDVIAFSKSELDRNGLVLANRRRLRKQDLTTELICLSNFKSLSRTNPKFFTLDLTKPVREVAFKHWSTSGQKNLVHLVAIWSKKKSKNCEIILQFKISVFYVNICSVVIYFCDQSCIFSIITPVFSVTWSSEIILICWFTAQETFLIIINVENSCAAQ